jgi:hypothetical protein
MPLIDKVIYFFGEYLSLQGKIDESPFTLRH